jgi:hypothetical protein
MDTQQRARHAVVDFCRHQVQWRRTTAHWGATIAIRLFCDSSGERLALFHFTGKSRLAGTAQFFWRLKS